MVNGYYTLVASADMLTDREQALPVGQSLSIYPNPGKGHFYFRLEQPLEEAAVLKIFDVNGAVVEQIEYPFGLGREIVELMLPELAKGQYFVELRSAKQRFSSRVIVE